jgi:hypothetical protein
VQLTDDNALAWATEVGPSTAAVMRLQFLKGNWPLMGYLITQAMKSLTKTHSNSRLDEACAYALANKITSIPDIRNILSKQLDKLFSSGNPPGK